MVGVAIADFSESLGEVETEETGGERGSTLHTRAKRRQFAMCDKGF